LIFLNYPNNPTSSVANESAFEEIVHWAHDNNVVVAHDAAYSELYSGEKPISFLQTPGAKEIGVEFHSFSKTFNMTGWRIGWICGNPDVVNALSQIKENIDSGAFGAIQTAALVALTSTEAETEVSRMRDIYAERRNVLVSGLDRNGWHVFHSNATFYVWAGVPDSESEIIWTERLLEKWGIVATPGSALGEHGRGFVRFSLTQPVERIKQALDRIK
jgi:LL-diaminopimelate aminotransferase